MQQTVLLFGACVTTLDPGELDTLHQQFGEHARFVESNPDTHEQHAENVHDVHADAVYVPKRVLSKHEVGQFDPIFGNTADIVPHYACQPDSDTLYMITSPSA